MTDLSKIWIDFARIDSDKLNLGLTELVAKNDNWNLIPRDLKLILNINNGQGLSNNGIFKRLINGKASDCYKFLDFDSILKFYEIVKGFNIPNVEDFEIPFAIKECQDIGGYGFSINMFDYTINYISFNEYDYNGGTIHNKGIFKYAKNMADFIENQIMIRQFE